MTLTIGRSFFERHPSAFHELEGFRGLKRRGTNDRSIHPSVDDWLLSLLFFWFERERESSQSFERERRGSSPQADEMFLLRSFFSCNRSSLFSKLPFRIPETEDPSFLLTRKRPLSPHHPQLCFGQRSSFSSLCSFRTTGNHTLSHLLQRRSSSESHHHQSIPPPPPSNPQPFLAFFRDFFSWRTVGLGVSTIFFFLVYLLYGFVVPLITVMIMGFDVFDLRESLVNLASHIIGKMCGYRIKVRGSFESDIRVSSVLQSLFLSNLSSLS